jgi:hypothetical protein
VLSRRCLGRVAPGLPDRDRSMQRFGVAQDAESKASKSFRACDAGGARFGVFLPRPPTQPEVVVPAADPLRAPACHVEDEPANAGYRSRRGLSS